MLSRKFLNLFYILIISLIILFILQSTSISRNSAKNGFRRNLIPTLIKPRILDLGFNSFYIAGITGETIYLGNITNPSFILTMDKSLSDTSHISIDVPKEGLIARRFLAVKIDSPFVFMFENITPAILVGNLKDQKVALHPIRFGGFLNWAPMSSSSMIVTAYDSLIHENIILKLNFSDSLIKTFQVLPKQFAGTFSTHGILNYDRGLNHLIFVYLYRNEFYRMDSNLQIQNRFHTIDTNSFAKVKIGHFDKGRYATFAEPPITVNDKSCISGNRFYINSGLRADNESKSAFEHNAVIDVYNLNTGKYEKSFYLPKLYDLTLKNFRVFQNTLIAIFDHYIVKYDFTKND